MNCMRCGRELTYTEITIGGMKRRMQNVCRCVIEEREAAELRWQAEELERRRVICFRRSLDEMRKCTFGNDDSPDDINSTACRNFADRFAWFRNAKTGLLLIGGIGTGKTYYAACIANELLEKGYTVKMTSLSDIIADLEGSFEGRTGYIDSLCRYDLLILDDFGIERRSEYVTEIIYRVVNARYSAGRPLLITSNIGLDEIVNPRDVDSARIYDRVLAMCTPIQFEGASRRRKAISSRFHDAQAVLKGERL